DPARAYPHLGRRGRGAGGRGRAARAGRRAGACRGAGRRGGDPPRARERGPRVPAGGGVAVNGLWTPSLQQAATSASAMLLIAILLIARLQRGQWLITLLFSAAFLALGALQAGALGLLRATTEGGAHVWADYLARVSALTSWLWLALSVLLGRPEPRRQLRE